MSGCFGSSSEDRYFENKMLNSLGDDEIEYCGICGEDESTCDCSYCEDD